MNSEKTPLRLDLVIQVGHATRSSNCMYINAVYSSTYTIFITQFLKSNINYI